MTEIKHLYIHVPFCNSICFYCDFCHRVYEKKTTVHWMERLEEEINKTCKGSYETIYIGGGTPSCLSVEELDRLFSMIEPFSKNVIEYTVEVNPESLEEEKALLFQRYGINRISMGVQSSDDSILRSLNRHHTYADAVDEIELLRKHGINNISVDLMYSLPGQTLEILKKTLEDILRLDVPHISLYSLTVEENTVFGKRGITPLDEDIEADMYEMICETLKQNGYIHYEISNFCKPNYESRHNLGYWNYDDFLGLSLGAAGKIGNIRYTNTSSFKKYFGSEDIREEVVELSREDMMFEEIMMSLRKAEGLDIEAFNLKYHADLLRDYEKGVSNRNIIIENGRLKCDAPAILNRVLLDFME